MSLVKLPFLVAVGLGTKVAFTPPHHAQKSEMAISPNLNRLFASAILPLMKTVFLSTTLAEATVIILSRVPSSQLSELALRLLRTLGGPNRTPINPYFIAGSLLVSLGSLLRWCSYRALGRLFTFDVAVRNEHKLITDGPYSVVRHPSYTGTISVMLGHIILFGYPDSWLRSSGVLNYPLAKGYVAVTACFIAHLTWRLFVRSTVEDRLMHGEFGKDWEDWARRVKYRIIPGIY